METNRIVLDLREVKDKVIELANSYPDSKYSKGDLTSCQYTKGEVTGTDCNLQGCIIGNAIRLCCPEAYKIIEDSETCGKLFNYVHTWVAGSVPGVTVVSGNDSVNTRGWLEIVQRKQDIGWAWKDTVIIANLQLAERETC